MVLSTTNDTSVMEPAEVRASSRVTWWLMTFERSQMTSGTAYDRIRQRCRRRCFAALWVEMSSMELSPSSYSMDLTKIYKHSPCYSSKVLNSLNCCYSRKQVLRWILEDWCLQKQDSRKRLLLEMVHRVRRRHRSSSYRRRCDDGQFWYVKLGLTWQNMDQRLKLYGPYVFSAYEALGSSRRFNRLASDS